MKAVNRLKKNEDFRHVYQSGKSMANKLLIIYIKESNLKNNRIGFCVSKKVGKSVLRSRVKRLLKESYRLNEEKFKKSYDVVFIARSGCSEATFKEIKSALMHLSKKMHLLVNTSGNKAE